MSATKILALANPSAGGGRGMRVQAAVESYLRGEGAEVEFRAPESEEELRREVAGAEARGYACVLAVGGDGTFHQVLNAAFGKQLTLGLVPAGGGNDIARALGIPLDPVEAAHALLHSRVRRVDVLRVHPSDGTTRLYAGAGGVGIDAEAARLANTRFRRVPGMARYIAAGLAAFQGAEALEVELQADGKRMASTAMLVGVANAPSYGSGVIIAPDARMDDGWMDLAVVAPLPWTRLLDGMLIALKDGRIRWPEMLHLKARQVRIHTDRPALFHGDGEILGETPVEVEVLPLALNVLAPPEANSTS